MAPRNRILAPRVAPRADASSKSKKREWANKMLSRGESEGQDFFHARKRTSPLRPLLNTRFNASRLIVRFAMVAAVVLFTETFTVAVGDASGGHFSQQQISSYIKTVTSELEVSKNWSANFGTTTSGKLYCNPVVLGEGVRSGNYGLYTWFTCSAMHKLDTANVTRTELTCTGFSSPVWIEPKAGKINYQPVVNGADYSSFRTSAPTSIQTLMDANYNRLNSGQSRVLVARAVQGTQVNTAISSTICQ